MNNCKNEAETQNWLLAIVVAQMAHEANLIWGMSRLCVVDSRSWEILSEDEMHKKAKLIEKYGTGEAITHEQQHENWMLTAPEDHPSNVPYADLAPDQKAKDLIFASHIKLYKDLLATHED